MGPFAVVAGVVISRSSFTLGGLCSLVSDFKEAFHSESASMASNMAKTFEVLCPAHWGKRVPRKEMMYV